jgi:hypothetical protein
VPGIAQDGAAVVYCTHNGTDVASINAATAAVSPVSIQWPDTRVAGAVVCVLACSSERALLVAAGPPYRNNLFTRLYHVAPGGQATVLLQFKDIDSEEFYSDETSESGKDIRLEQSCLDANGDLVGITAEGLLVRVLLAHSVQPAHLQQSPTSSDASGSGKDWASLLGSEEGADVQLRCAEGAVVKAHSAVLLHRWEYYRLLHQRDIAAGMPGSAGEVDVSEHSAAGPRVSVHRHSPGV